MKPPLLSYITCSYMGMTAYGIPKILEADDDFDMHIVDCDSKDDTWKLVSRMCDRRIKSSTRFGETKGPAYALNYNLSKREAGQFFIKIDNDAVIHNRDWICRFLKVFDTFTEAGLLMAVYNNPESFELTGLVPKYRAGTCYLKLDADTADCFSAGCWFFRPEIFNYEDFWCPESCFNGNEICRRARLYTPYTIGLMTDIKIGRNSR